MSFRRIVIGIDFSERSLAAGRWVATQFAPEAEIVLVHALRGPDAPAFIQPYLEPMMDVVSDVAPALYGGLRGFADLIGPDRTTLDMRIGLPAEVLARVAEEAEADLITIARTQRWQGSARFGANMAQRLLDRTPLPVMVVPHDRQAPPGRVLVALDDRIETQAVMGAAWRFASAIGARLDLLHVLGADLHGFVRACRPDGPHGRLAAGDAEAAAGGREVRVHDESHLFQLTREWMTSQAKAAGALATTTDVHVTIGDAGQEIVAMAEARNADLIVVGRGGAATQPSAVNSIPASGSTARLVTWSAPCPVLVLPPPARGVPGIPARSHERATRQAGIEEGMIARAPSDGLRRAAHSKADAEVA